MKQKYKCELKKLRADHLELLSRHEALCRYCALSLSRITNNYKHLTEALSQRGVWNHDYSDEKRAN